MKYNPSASGAVVCSLPLILSAFLGAGPASAGEYFVRWSRKCPPSNYLTPAQKAAVMGGAVNPTTPLDYDLTGNGMKSAWSIPIRIPNPAGGQFQTTDAKGNSVFLVGIPDPAGLGFGSDHYSPRFRANGAAKAGVEVGQCVYEEGRNLWRLDFTDNQTAGTPDQFTKSIWRSRNGDATAANFDERTYFVTDLTKDKIVVDKVVKMPGMNLTPGFSISASTLVDAGVELSKVQLGGSTIPLPGPSPTVAGVAQTIDTDLPEEQNVLNDPQGTILPGEKFTIDGTLTNTYGTSLTYALTYNTIGCELLSAPQTLTLGPGASASYQLLVEALKVGDAAVSSLAYETNTNAPGDGWADAAIFTSVPEPSSWVLGLLGALGLLGLARLRRGGRAIAAGPGSARLESADRPAHARLIAGRPSLDPRSPIVLPARGSFGRQTQGRAIGQPIRWRPSCAPALSTASDPASSHKEKAP